MSSSMWGQMFALQRLKSSREIPSLIVALLETLSTQRSLQVLAAAVQKVASKELIPSSFP